MKEYVVIADSVTFKGKVLKKGQKIVLDNETAKPLIKAKAIEPVEGVKAEAPAKKEEVKK